MILYQRTLVIYKRINPNHPRIEAILNNINDTRQTQSKLVEARDLFVRSFQLSKTHFGPKSHTLIISLDNLRSMELDLDQPKMTLGYFERALEINELSLGQNNEHSDMTH